MKKINLDSFSDKKFKQLSKGEQYVVKGGSDTYATILTHAPGSGGGIIVTAANDTVEMSDTPIESTALSSDKYMAVKS